MVPSTSVFRVLLSSQSLLPDFSPCCLTPITSPSCLACFPRAFLSSAHNNGLARVESTATHLKPGSQRSNVNRFLVQRQFLCFGNPTKPLNWEGVIIGSCLLIGRYVFPVLVSFLYLWAVLHTPFWPGTHCERFEAVPSSGVLTQGGIFAVQAFMWCLGMQLVLSVVSCNSCWSRLCLLGWS